ncbi:MAG TPA: PAS domain S-box protein, partial [Candidatus Ozemobacteraceae bacterium]|nr:PAS domain S-box protein [Candidatus Ozemobacteraceae bacterium]
MALSLIYTASLLLTLVLLHDVVVSTRRGIPSCGRLIVSGIILGGIGVVLSMTPLNVVPGIIYDTRSVLVSISGLFLGTIPTCLAMFITAANRLFFVGGVGAWTGTAVIFTSGAMGLAWRRLRKGPVEEVTWLDLFLFGVLVHVVMLLLMLTLPGDLGWKVISVVALPVIIIYPTITALLGALLVNRLRQQAIRRALQASEERLRATLYSIGDAVISTDCESRVQHMNPAAETMIGWNESEARGKRVDEVFRVIHEETGLPVENPVEAVLRHGKSVGLADHTLLVSHDGRETPIADSAAPIEDELGTTIGVVLVLRSQAAERAMERERVMLTETIRASRNEIYVFDAKTLLFRFVNQGALANLGYTFDQISLLCPVDLQPEFTTESFLQLVEPLVRHEKPLLIFETAHRRADGSRYPVEVHLQLVDHKGERVFLAIMEDITLRKQAEEKARQAMAEAEKLQDQLFHLQKMESVGRLAGG